MGSTAPGPVRRAGPQDAAGIAVVHVRSWQGAERAGWTADGSAKQDDIGGARVTEVRYRRPLP